MDLVTPVLEGWRHGELRVQCCAACGARQFPPRAICLACRSDRLTWIVMPSRGKIHTFTIVHRAPTDAFRSRTPYAIALVDLAPGVRMMMNVESDPSAIAVDALVTIGFTTDEEQPLPVGTIAAAPAG